MTPPDIVDRLERAAAESEAWAREWSGVNEDYEDGHACDAALLRAAAAEIERLRGVGWVACSEREPKRGKTVLAWCGRITVGYIDTADQWTFDETLETYWQNGLLVTHWSPLPQPPEGK